MKNILTFVCCIEQGRLEKQTLLMLDTLRSNAGEFANCHVIAVVGRFGAKLSPKTIELLKQFNVELYVAKNENPYAWFNYSNKVVAVNVAQRKAKTPCIAWLDSDVLFLNQPNGFMLNDEEDFLASLDYFPPAVVEKELTQIPYWQSLCSILNVDFSNIPIVKNQLNNKSQHIYLSSGVMVWRKDTNFAIAYRDAFVKVMASKLAQHNGTFFTADQVPRYPCSWSKLHS